MCEVCNVNTATKIADHVTGQVSHSIQVYTAPFYFAFTISKRDLCFLKLIDGAVSCLTYLSR